MILATQAKLAELRQARKLEKDDVGFFITVHDEDGKEAKERIQLVETKGDEDVFALQEMLERVKDTGFNLQVMLTSLLNKMRSNSYSKEELADLGFLCRRLELMFDELRKEAKARHEIAGMMVAKIVISESMSDDPNASLTVKGKIGTCEPSVKQAPEIPRRGTKEYVELCAHFGLNEEAIGNAILEPHYVRMCDYVTKQISEGKGPPPGVRLRSTTFSASYRKRLK